MRARKNSGNEKGKVIRIKESTKEDLNFMRKILNLSAKYNEGDTIEYLVGLVKKISVDNPNFLAGCLTTNQICNLHNNQMSMDDFNFLKTQLEESNTNVSKWVKRFDIAIEKGNLNRVEIIEMIK